MFLFMFFDSKYILFKETEDSVRLADNTSVLPIVVKESEHKRIHRVAKDLQNDLKKVTGKKPEVLNELPESPAVILTTVDNDSLIDELNLDTSELDGKWESFAVKTILHPKTNEDVIVILGSDTRGAIFGVYDLTEKMGVSPWYWWMDVPIKKHHKVYLKKGSYLQGEPSIQYRGFFLNDEGPSLMTWVRKHFPDFTHEFYEKIFELTLRLKANYHWPAMWDSTFYEDDEQNIVKADEYGVVIGTSHHEPMDRPHGDWKTHKKGPWDYEKNESYLRQFWSEGIHRSKPYETIINLGMRGDGDMPMGGDLNFSEKITLMEKIIKDQREIIQNVISENSIEDVPQMWALYKEVKEYYDAGMDVPEDITLLWGDDNWGNIRRLPTKEERKRSGGAGIYYHFDYVGGPRSYKWVNTVPIHKTWEQMHKAYEYDARKVWIVNVGDLKPMEFQTEFFLRLAWNIDAFNQDNLWAYTVEWAEYTFGEAYGQRVAKVIHDYVKFNGRLKPELINAVDLYSWDHYFEAERIIEEFEETIEMAENLLEDLPDPLKDSFYQVGYYPAKASFTVLKLQLMSNLSKKYAERNLPIANVAARKAELLFEEDKRLTFDYNKRISNGKWDHMMDQLHIGYTYWNQPDELLMPEVARVAEEDFSDGEWFVEIADSDATDCYSKKSIVIDLYNKGSIPLDLSVVSRNKWLEVSEETFQLNIRRRLFFKVDWGKIPFGIDIKGIITIKDNSGRSENIAVTIHNPEEKLQNGYVPVGGVIAIEAEEFSRKTETTEHQWQVIPDYGRTKSSVAIYPVELNKDYQLTEAPRLEYDIYVDKAGQIELMVFAAPSLPFDPDRDIRIGLSLDDKEVEIVTAGDMSQNGERDSKDWERSVMYNVHEFKAIFNNIEVGYHTIKVTLIDPQVVIQKVIVNSGGLKPSYLGPLPTPNAGRLENYEVYIPEQKEDFSVLPGNLINVSKNSFVFIEKAGWYSLKSEKKWPNLESIDGVPFSTDDLGNNEYYFPAGMHTLNFSDGVEDISVELIKMDDISVRTSLRIQKRDSKDDEWMIQIVLQNQGDLAHSYDIQAELTAMDTNESVYRFGTKGIVKKDEQKLHTQTFFKTTESKLVQLSLEIISGGRKRTENFEFTFKKSKKQ